MDLVLFYFYFKKCRFAGIFENFDAIKICVVILNCCRIKDKIRKKNCIKKNELMRLLCELYTEALNKNDKLWIYEMIYIVIQSLKIKRQNNFKL